MANRNLIITTLVIGGFFFSYLLFLNQFFLILGPTASAFQPLIRDGVTHLILLHEKFLQFDWLRAVVFQLNLKYLHAKITNLLR